MYGQLASGGWTNSINFNPRGERVAKYRNGKGGGRNYSTLDDGITQNALRFMIRLDQALGFKDAEVHEATRMALDALLAAQFPNGGFPQVWTGPSAPQPIEQAKYPDYEWRTENRIREYWNLYTLNDDLVGYVAAVLFDALEVYDNPKCKAALVKLGDFLVLAQMPAPQPAWAQQYDYRMRPVWARRFEPPAISGRESQDAIATLFRIYELTNDNKYLEGIPRALAYLRTSLLPDGQLARYYELQTNKPLYMTPKYELTYDGSRVADHYGWKGPSRIEEFEQRLAGYKSGSKAAASTSDASPQPRRIREIIQQLDEQGRWISEYDGQMLVGQPKYRPGDRYIACAVFNQNLESLSRFLQATAKERAK
jgi:PelA/Pel-15E family pectate lyase